MILILFKVRKGCEFTSSLFLRRKTELTACKSQDESSVLANDQSIPQVKFEIETTPDDENGFNEQGKKDPHCTEILLNESFGYGDAVEDEHATARSRN